MEAIASIEDPTLRFFLEGEAMEKEARRAEAARVAPDRGPGFAGHFGNDNGDTLFVRDARDEQPVVERRGHGGAIAFAALSSLTAIGVAAWMWMTPPVRPALWWLKGPAPAAAVTETQPEATTQAMAAPTAEANTETTVPAAAPPVVAPAVAAETGSSRGSATDEAVAASVPGAPIIEQLPPPPAAAAPAVKETVTERPARGEALRGYVWSPSAKAMVPSEPSSSTAAVPAPESAAAPTDRKAADAPAPTPTASPDSVMAPASLSGPGIAAPTTGPAPDETARVPSTEPAPFEPGTQAPAKPSAPIID